jgi:hypothetical protein
MSEKLPKKTVVLGASTNPSRYSYIAANMLTDKGHPVIPVGIKKGVVAGKEILDLRTKPRLEGVDTITLYLGPSNQVEWYDYILSLQPERIVFNPGTENDELVKKASENGINTVYACTLVMLSVGNY